MASKRAYIPPDFSACNQPRVWGLTVDDGPLPGHCALYQLFSQNNITASLFYIARLPSLASVLKARRAATSSTTLARRSRDSRLVCVAKSPRIG